MPLLVLVAGISCGHLTDPPLPANAQVLIPPPVYAKWWGMVESCSGLSGSLENIQWYSTTSLLRDPNGNGSLQFKTQFALGELGRLANVSAKPDGTVVMRVTRRVRRRN